jgi:hypothetical protein
MSAPGRRTPSEVLAHSYVIEGATEALVKAALDYLTLMDQIDHGCLVEKKRLPLCTRADCDLLIAVTRLIEARR